MQPVALPPHCNLPRETSRACGAGLHHGKLKVAPPSHQALRNAQTYQHKYLFISDLQHKGSNSSRQCCTRL